MTNEKQNQEVLHSRPIFYRTLGLQLLSAALILSLTGCRSLFGPVNIPGVGTTKEKKTFTEKVRKKARLQLRNGTESINIKVAGDSILIKIIAPENARIKVKGRKQNKREHPNQ